MKKIKQLYKHTNNMHFLCVFILQFLYDSTCFDRTFRSPSAVHDLLYLQLCTNRVNVSIDKNADDERNGRSKHVELYKKCRKNTYRKCILLVYLYNWIRCCTVHTVAKLKFRAFPLTLCHFFPDCMTLTHICKMVLTITLQL